MAEWIPIAVTSAKLLVRLLPFLARRGRLTGRWRAEYQSQESGAAMKELVEAQHFRTIVWGTIAPVDNPDDPRWTFYGRMRDQVLVGIYMARERLGHWSGAFCLVLKGDSKLKGNYVGFEEDTGSIVGSEYSWTKLN